MCVFLNNAGPLEFLVKYTEYDRDRPEEDLPGVREAPALQISWIERTEA